MNANSPYLDDLLRAINGVLQDSARQADGRKQDAQRHVDAERDATEKAKYEGELSRIPTLANAFDAHIKSKTENINQDREERKKYTNRLFWVVASWLPVVILITIASGVECIKFSLDESVLIALISGASIGFVGALVAIVKYLFRRD